MGAPSHSREFATATFTCWLRNGDRNRGAGQPECSRRRYCTKINCLLSDYFRCCKPAIFAGFRGPISEGFFVWGGQLSMPVPISNR
jgi:hypothetical protein